MIGRYPPMPDDPSAIETHDHASTCSPMARSLESIAHTLRKIEILLFSGIMVIAIFFGYVIWAWR